MRFQLIWSCRVTEPYEDGDFTGEKNVRVGVLLGLEARIMVDVGMDVSWAELDE